MRVESSREPEHHHITIQDKPTLLCESDSVTVTWVFIQDFVWKHSAQTYGVETAESLHDKYVKIVIDHERKVIVFDVPHY